VVARRGQTQAAITKGVEAGDHVALDDPEAGRK
jgi:hypothetical protein